MRVLIAVKSCVQDRIREYHSVIRETWGKDVKDADLRFFMGGQNLKGDDDEIFLYCADDYANLPYKTREILRWSVQHEYDYTFLCDNDTFVIPAKLMKTGFEQWDYFGKIDRTPHVTFNYNAVDREGHVTGIEACYAWASGGFGYFVSRQAAEYIIHEDPDIWAEDLWVGQLLGPINRGFKIGHMQAGSTFHFPQTKYKSGYDLKFGWMEEMYREHQ